MATKKKRRVRSSHPGVVLIPPRGKHATWRARFDDPDTGRQTAVRLDPVALPSAETRRTWAIQKSKANARRKMEIEVGASPIAFSALDEAVGDYYREAGNRLRPSTLALYRTATDAFLNWARARGISSTKMLRATVLPAFRDHLVAQRKGNYVRGGRRGQRTDGSEKVSPQTVNWQLRAVKTVLNHLRVRGQVPLTSDAISDALKPLTVPREAPEFLRPTECAQLLEAALKHDADTFAATRDEHAGNREAGTTQRYDPIAPFVAVVLLCGFRVGEALSLRWAAVDLAAVDADGKPKGEVRLMAADTKTKHARTVSLDVSPTVRTLLNAMKLRAGKDEYVFGGSKPMPKSQAEAARRRLVGEVPKKERKADTQRKRKVKDPIDFGAPRNFTWQVLRSTCATFQCNAPAIFGDAAAFKSAKRLGHSTAVSEKLYADQFDVSREARTLEQAMGIEDVMAGVVAASKSSLPGTALTCSPVRGTI